MANTIADAIGDSKQQFTKRYRRETMPAMAKKYPLTSSVEILRRLVDQAGGPAKFAKKYSIGDPDNPINPTYVSQILNGNRPFRDTARAQMAKRAGLPETYFEAASPSVQQPLVEYKATPELSEEGGQYRSDNTDISLPLCEQAPRTLGTAHNHQHLATKQPAQPSEQERKHSRKPTRSMRQATQQPSIRRKNSK